MLASKTLSPSGKTYNFDFESRLDNADGNFHPDMTPEDLEFTQERGYKIVKRLGAGQTRDALLASSASGEDEEIESLVAVKQEKPVIDGSVNAVINAAKGNLNDAEIRIINETHCPYVARIVDTFVPPSGRRINAEVYHGGVSLEDRIKSDGPLRLDRAKKFATQLFEAISAIHKSGIVHRVISPNNTSTFP